MASTLNAQARTGNGKGAARKLRSTGRVPGVLYGHGDQNRPLDVDALELTKLLASISIDNTLIDLTIGGAESTSVLIRDLQRHAYKPEILHVDFLQVHAGETLKLQIPVRLNGTPVGVHTHSGVLDHVIYDVEIECLPRNIPEVVEVDVSNLDVGDSIRVRDLVVSDDVKILTDGDLAVASVVGARREEEPVVAEATDGPGGTVEPELIREDAADES